LAVDGFIGFLSETIFLCPDYWYHRVNNYWDCVSIDHYLMIDENCSKMTLRDCNTCLIDFNHLATYCLSSIQIFYKLCQSFGGDAPQALFRRACKLFTRKYEILDFEIYLWSSFSYGFFKYPCSGYRFSVIFMFFNSRRNIVLKNDNDKTLLEGKGWSFSFSFSC
jgi:hypothetical protein